VEEPAPIQYTAKDFQLEVLGRLAEMQNLAESLEESAPGCRTSTIVDP
jgi:hypothetical protein